MKRIFIISYMTLLSSQYLIVKSGYLQERAVVKYANPKYISEAKLFTGRVRRGEPYLTNASVITLQPWNNNVTLVTSYETRKVNEIELQFKFCDIVKHKWIIDFVQAYADLAITCPLEPGLYRFWNVELPPKNLPLPLLNTDYRLTVMFYMTATKEKIIELVMGLHFVHNKKERYLK